MRVTFIRHGGCAVATIRGRAALRVVIPTQNAHSNAGFFTEQSQVLLGTRRLLARLQAVARRLHSAEVECPLKQT